MSVAVAFCNEKNPRDMKDGYEADWLESDIIALPELRDGSSTTETLYIDVDVVPHSEKVQVNFSYKLYGEVLNFDFENADKTQNHPYPFQGNNSTYIQYDGKKEEAL